MHTKVRRYSSSNMIHFLYAAQMILATFRPKSSLVGSGRSTMPDEDDEDSNVSLPVSSLFLPPPKARTALHPEHIQDAFTRMQTEWSFHRNAGMRNWRGGLVRTNVGLI